MSCYQNTVNTLWLLNQQVCRRKLVVLHWKFENYLLTNLFLFILLLALHPYCFFWTAMWSLWRCSSGFDRHRQDWVDSGCPEEVHMFFIMKRFRETSCHIQYRCYSLLKMVSHSVKVDSSYQVPWDFKSLHVFSQFILIPILWGRGCYCPHITSKRRGRGERRWLEGM